MGASRYRVLVLVTHVVQYGSQAFRKMASHPKLDVLVAYCSLQGSQAAVDPEFGVKVKWDVPLLDGFPWKNIPNRSPSPGLGRFWGLVNPGLWSLVRNGGFDAVAIFSGYRYASSWIAGIAAKLSGIPILFSTDAHDLSSFYTRAWKKWFKRVFWPILFRLPDRALALSSGGTRMLQNLKIPEDRISLTPFTVDNDWWIESARGVDQAAIRVAWKIPEQATVALFSGKLQPWKRPMDLLRAFHRADISSAFLVFAGDGPLRGELERETRVLGLSGRVRVLGFVNQRDLPAVYCGSDLLVLPSEHEAFGVAVNEAMLCGRPAVVSDCVGARYDLVCEGETGFVYPVGNIEALSEVLGQLLRDPVRLAEMGEAARHRMEQWSPARYIEAFVEAVEKATQMKKAG